MSEYADFEKADENDLFCAGNYQERIEDRARFVRNAGRLAAQTRAGVKRIDYIGGHPEIVRIVYTKGSHRDINISHDSYTAIVQDIFRAI